MVKIIMQFFQRRRLLPLSLLVLTFTLIVFWIPAQAQTELSPTNRNWKNLEIRPSILPKTQTVSHLTPGFSSPDEAGIVNAVLFWMEGCPECEPILKDVIPPLEEKYGDALAIEMIEIESVQDVDKFYQLGARMGIGKQDIEVPLLVIGEQYLIGQKEIKRDLAALIEKYLLLGGVDTPQIPEFFQSMSGLATEVSTPSPGEPCKSCEIFDMDDLSPTLTSIAFQSTQSATQEYPTTQKSTTAIYLFWGDGCPHCAVAKPFLERLDEFSDQIVLKSYEVWYVEENQTLFTEMASAHGFEPHYVPTIFVGDRYWEGYNDQIQAEIQAAVNQCLKSGCTDAGAGIANDTISITPPLEEPKQTGQDEVKSQTIALPILGTIDLSSQSLLISTLLISFVDGFNPCSIWVLTMLLALTLHTGSRKKVLLIGLVFLTVTAAIYGLFITGLFSMLKVVSFTGWIQLVVALVALFFALVNIKDYFRYKEGFSFTISDKKKPGIYQRIRKLMDAGQSFWGLVGGTVVLAAGVSLVEFSCTAGFPVLWSNLLVSQSVPTVLFIVLLIVYLLIYQLDELGIFLVAVFSMRASRLEEKHGRILKLVGGILMLTLAGVMLIKPSLMNDLSSSLIIFGIAFSITVLILLVHRLILPRFGIFLGSEFNKKMISRASGDNNTE